MGHFYAPIKMYSKDLFRSKEVLLLVDTGSTYTWVKRNTLEDLGMVADGKWKFKTIEGKEIEREIGEAIAEYDTLRATTIVVFGLEGDAEVLGVYTLEGLGLEVDPITKTLKRTISLAI